LHYQVSDLVRLVTEAFAGTDDLERDLRAFARQFMHALMPPEVLRLRRLGIANADRFPEMGRAWYAHGFERALAALTEQFRRLTPQRLLDADDPEMAAQHFVGLLLWIPVNKVMFSGESAAPSAEDLNHYADAAVAVFLRAYARQHVSAPHNRQTRCSATTRVGWRIGA